MNEKLDTTLCGKYSKIFADRHGDMRTTAMCWGFEHGDGWYDILDRACYLIQSHIDSRNQFIVTSSKFNDALQKALDGDKDALIQFYANGDKVKDWMYDAVESDLMHPRFRPAHSEIPQLVAEQVKEKYGTLRFYYHGGDDYCDGVVAMAESMSAITCETCGKAGKIRGGGWLYTACDEHTREKDKDEKPFV